MDFKAQCDNTSISGLALSHSLLIDSIAFRSGLKKLFNGFNPSLNNVTTVSMLVRFASTKFLFFINESARYT